MLVSLEESFIICIGRIFLLSLKKILLQLKEKMNFPYGKTHLWRLLKKMGFGYEKRGRQRIISERPEIIAWRERYLRQIRKIREAGPERTIAYTDETWRNQGHRTKKEWVDLGSKKKPKIFASEWLDSWLY